MNTGINRIRLEFKEDHSCFLATKTARVLIESDWNLKLSEEGAGSYPIAVLIESDWNLKDSHSETHPNHRAVLIESDWNLKEAVKFKDLLPILTGINRIRLEFKGHIKMPDDS